MFNQNKKRILIIASGVCIIAAAVLAVILFFPKTKKPETFVDPNLFEAEDKKLTNRQAYDLAKDRALAWQADASLANIVSVPGETGRTGHADDWRLLFVSKNKTGTALSIEITDQRLGKIEELPYFGEGAAMPADTITSEEAIARVRQIAGYETEPIVSVEMIYNPDAREWRWGVKTGRGTVTVKATR